MPSFELSSAYPVDGLVDIPGVPREGWDYREGMLTMRVHSSVPVYLSLRRMGQVAGFRVGRSLVE
jgi:hypothetical protein